MKQLITKFNPVRAFRNACIAGGVGLATSPVFAASVIDITPVQAAMSDGKGDMATIGGYVLGALVVLAVAGLIYAMVRKA